MTRGSHPGFFLLPSIVFQSLYYNYFALNTWKKFCHLFASLPSGAFGLPGDIVEMTEIGNYSPRTNYKKEGTGEDSARPC
jgi:hypothetical protein